MLNSHVFSLTSQLLYFPKKVKKLYTPPLPPSTSTSLPPPTTCFSWANPLSLRVSVTKHKNVLTGSGGDSEDRGVSMSTCSSCVCFVSYS